MEEGGVPHENSMVANRSLIVCPDYGCIRRHQCQTGRSEFIIRHSQCTADSADYRVLADRGLIVGTFGIYRQYQMQKEIRSLAEQLIHIREVTGYTPEVQAAEEESKKEQKDAPAE